ncbi:MAG TPA: histidine kinase, partial [Blastocatellia bacterium]|nr:histidine kinase [Blastocatellia bacterium]
MAESAVALTDSTVPVVRGQSEQGAFSASAMPRWLTTLLTFGFFSLVGLLIFSYKYLDDLARHRSGTLLIRVLEEGTGTYAAALLFPLLVRFARRFRPNGENWHTRIPLHLAGLLIFSCAHTTLNGVSRWMIFPMLGLGHYDYGILSIRYFMELANDAIVYLLALCVVYGFDYYRRSRDRELERAQLETQLAQAQLQSLRLQLQPHFLFNALNTISSLIYEDVAAADAMIARLSELLRVSLSSPSSQEALLDEELAFLSLYLDVMRARFQDRLTVSLDVAPETRRALVPQFVLQPLVENSIKHAGPTVPDGLAIEICVRLE